MDWTSLQRRLSALGYSPGRIDGRDGPRTRDAVKAFQRAHGLTADGVYGPKTERALSSAEARDEPTTPPWDGRLTERIVLEVAAHEAIVQEAYKDSVGVWTWAIGVTDASGHHVGRYRDHPQPVERCVEVSIWLMREKYLPDVLAAFAGYSLTEAETAAALSFHYNTGKIKRASWVRSVVAGNREVARQQIMEWRKPSEIVPRRQAERDLFFDGRWSGDGTVMVWPVRKPSYAPHWGRCRRVDIRSMVREALK